MLQTGTTFLHLGVGDRGAPRQDRRPDLGRGARRRHARRPDRTRRLRDPRHDGPRLHRGRDLDQDVRRPPVDRPPDDQGDRLHARQVRLRLRDLRGHVLDRPPVARHRPGRGHRGSRRPGHDVRLRGPGDRGADAAPADARPPPRPAPLGVRGARGSSTSCGRTASPRSPSSTRAPGRSASRPSSSRPSTPRPSSTRP